MVQQALVSRLLALIRASEIAEWTDGTGMLLAITSLARAALREAQGWSSQQILQDLRRIVRPEDRNPPGEHALAQLVDALIRDIRRRPSEDLTYTRLFAAYVQLQSRWSSMRKDSGVADSSDRWAWAPPPLPTGTGRELRSSDVDDVFARLCLDALFADAGSLTPREAPDYGCSNPGPQWVSAPGRTFPSVPTWMATAVLHSDRRTWHGLLGATPWWYTTLDTAADAFVAWYLLRGRDAEPLRIDAREGRCVITLGLHRPQVGQDLLSAAFDYDLANLRDACELLLLAWAGRVRLDILQVEEKMLPRLPSAPSHCPWTPPRLPACKPWLWKHCTASSRGSRRPTAPLWRPNCQSRWPCTISPKLRRTRLATWLSR
ncbi:hypothetical protein ACFQZC_09060 [Streptacidiphilus monticola]